MSKYYELISPYSFPGLKKLGLSKKYDYLNRVGTSLTKENVLEIVARECSVTVSDIVSPSRKLKIVEARMIVTKILREKLEYTQVETGQAMGNREHTTIGNLESNFKEDYEKKQDFKEKSDRIFKIVNFTI